MRASQETQLGAYDAALKARAPGVSADSRRAVADATIRAYEAERAQQVDITQKPWGFAILDRVRADAEYKQHLKSVGFIEFIILAAILSWLVQRVLDFLFLRQVQGVY